MRIELESLVLSMPQGELAAALPDIQVSGITTRPRPESPYVWPDVLGEAPQEPSPIVLISAPGAMGKSAAARTIAARLGSIYIDLAGFRVGSGTLTGELSKAFGLKQVSEFVEMLKEGKTSIVLDSTDEAQLRSGRDNYVAFLEDLLWLLSDAESAQQVVLLGRQDSIETTLLALMDLGHTPPMYEIAPLSQSQAHELIDMTLDARKMDGAPYTVHRVHSGPFAEMRESVLTALAAALDADCLAQPDYWDRVETFLGYPPVLLALSERLAVENPTSAPVQDQFAAGVTRGDVLKDIVETILERERGKVAGRVGDALGLAFDGPERSALYSFDEQAARLLRQFGTIGVDLDKPALLDAADRAKYEDNIQSFVVDHPFMKGASFANTVFSDYVRAWAVSSPISGLYTSSRSRFLNSLPRRGPFFCYFLHSMSGPTDDIGKLPEDLVSDAIHSFGLGGISFEASYYHQGDAAALYLHSRTDAGIDNTLRFEVTDLSGVLTLESPLARVFVASEHAVVLVGEDEVELGPRAALVVGELVIKGRSFNAIGGRSDRVGGGVVISANLVSHNSDLRVAAHPAQSLVVNWPDYWYQWKEFYIDLPVDDPRLGRQQTAQVLLCTRRVLTSFGSSLLEQPSVSADKMDRVIIGSNRVFKATLAALISLGVVSRASTLYVLHLDKLGSYGVSWSDLHGADPVNALRSLVGALVADESFEELKQ